MDREESIGWYRGVIRRLDSDSIAEPFTDQTAVEFDKQQHFFDNVAYHRQSLYTSRYPLAGEDRTCPGCPCLPNLRSGSL